jgi:hypothetical protein
MKTMKNKVIKNTLPDSLYRNARRKFLYTLCKGYIKKSLAARKGKCNACGCCRALIVPCKYLKGEKCTVYGTKEMPQGCLNYPIDRADMNPYSKKNCGYYWEKKK